MLDQIKHGEIEDKSVPQWVEKLIGQWRIFVPLTLVVAAGVYTAVQARSYHFESKGFVSLHRDVSQYNAQRQAFYDYAQLRRYLEQNKKLDTPEGQYLLASLSTKFLNKHVVLSMPYGKDDVRYVSDNDRSALVSTGLDITAESNESGEQAAARLQLLADYVVDQMLKQTLTSDLRSKLMAARSKRQTLDNQLIATKQNFAELTARLGDTRQIAARYPEAAQLNERQLLTTSGESGRFLSPIAQMVGLEADIASLKAAQARLERSQQVNNIALGFYEDLEKKVPANPTGAQLLSTLRAEIKSHFGTTPPVDDVTREVYNNELLLVQAVRSQGLNSPRFTSGPTAPAQMQGTPRALLLLLALVIGAFVAGGATLLFDFIRSTRQRFALPLADAANGTSTAGFPDNTSGAPSNRQKRA